MEDSNSSAAVRRVRAGLLSVLLVAALALAAATASAQVVHLRNGTTISYQPLPGATAPSTVHRFSEIGPALEWHGGLVMTSNTNYTIYWAPPKSPKYAPKYIAGVNKYFKDVAHDSGGTQNVESVLTQYGTAVPLAFRRPDQGQRPVSGERLHGCPDLFDRRAAADRDQARRRKRQTAAGRRSRVLPAHAAGRRELRRTGSCSANSSEPFYCAYHSDIGHAQRRDHLRERPVRPRKKLRRTVAAPRTARPTRRCSADSATSTASRSPTPS